MTVSVVSRRADDAYGGAEREGDGSGERVEAALYPVLQTFLLERESVLSRRIREQTNSNRRGRNGNKWLHPDVVGMHAPGRDWLDVVRRCSMERKCLARTLPRRTAMLAKAPLDFRRGPRSPAWCPLPPS